MSNISVRLPWVAAGLKKTFRTCKIVPKWTPRVNPAGRRRETEVPSVLCRVAIHELRAIQQRHAEAHKRRAVREASGQTMRARGAVGAVHAFGSFTRCRCRRLRQQHIRLPMIREVGPSPCWTSGGATFRWEELSQN